MTEVHVVAKTRRAHGGAAYGFDWVDVNGTRLTAEDHHLRAVKYENEGGKFAEVTIMLIPTSFISTDTDPGEGDYDPLGERDEEIQLEMLMEGILSRYGIPVAGLRDGLSDRGDLASVLASTARGWMAKHGD